MPLYVYKCSACEETIEIMHSVGNVPVNCPNCNSTSSLQRTYNYEIKVADKKNETLASNIKNHIENVKNDLEEQKKELLGKKQ